MQGKKFKWLEALNQFKKLLCAVIHNWIIQQNDLKKVQREFVFFSNYPLQRAAHQLTKLDTLMLNGILIRSFLPGVTYD